MIGRAPAFALALSILLAPAASSAAAGDDEVSGLCEGLARSVAEAAPDGGPVFVASYRPGPAPDRVPEALRTAAFAYDNALAIAALVACGDLGAARRIGDAFLVAIASDRTFRDGRVRNAYRAGPVRERPVPLPGWWDAEAGRWAEDRYQDGTATGNVAWVGLALTTLHGATGEGGYRDGAQRLASWIRANAGGGPDGGFTGGRDGFDAEQTPLAWASTEHNLDILALGTRLGTEQDRAMAASARRFVEAAFDAGTGCFRMGTTPEGRMRDADALALDTQVWPVLALAHPPPAWRRALSCADARLSVEGGYDFDADRDGLWVEGTAQAALAFRAAGEAGRARELLAGLSAQRAPGGWLYATREPRVTTGLTIGPQSREADFLYYRRPHLGATAWAALAGLGWNPFLGRRVE